MIDATVIMCVYNRPHYLPTTLQSYAAQTLKLPLVIINNNPAMRDEFTELVKGHNVRLIHNDSNTGGMARFTTARDFVTSEYVIFIDDDQDIKPNMIAHLANNAIKGIAGLWCFNYRGNGGTRDRVHKGNAHYIGTGGQIAVRSIFESSGLYDEYPKQPQPFLPKLNRPCMEDLWSSFYARNRLGLRTIACGALEKFARNMNRDAKGNLTCKMAGNTSITWNFKPKFIRWMGQHFGENLK